MGSSFSHSLRFNKYVRYHWHLYEVYIHLPFKKWIDKMANQATELNCQLLTSEKLELLTKCDERMYATVTSWWRSSPSESSRLERRRQSMPCPQLHENPACSYFLCNRRHPLLYPGFAGSHDMLAVSRVRDSHGQCVYTEVHPCVSQNMSAALSPEAVLLCGALHIQPHGDKPTLFEISEWDMGAAW